MLNVSRSTQLTRAELEAFKYVAASLQYGYEPLVADIHQKLIDTHVYGNAKYLLHRLQQKKYIYCKEDGLTPKYRLTPFGKEFSNTIFISKTFRLTTQKKQNFRKEQQLSIPADLTPLAWDIFIYLARSNIAANFIDIEKFNQIIKFSQDEIRQEIACLTNEGYVNANTTFTAKGLFLKNQINYLLNDIEMVQNQGNMVAASDLAELATIVYEDENAAHELASIKFPVEALEEYLFTPELESDEPTMVDSVHNSCLAEFPASPLWAYQQEFINNAPLPLVVEALDEADKSFQLALSPRN